MNILTALRGGKRFRRKSKPVYNEAGWHSPRGSNIPASCCAFTVEDILADDWEEEETKVTVTASMLAAAWADSSKEFEIEYGRAYNYREPSNSHMAAQVFKMMLRKLGL